MRMAEVIFCVFLMDAILPFISLSDAIVVVGWFKIQYWILWTNRSGQTSIAEGGEVELVVGGLEVLRDLGDEVGDVVVNLARAKWGEDILLVGGA